MTSSQGSEQDVSKLRELLFGQEKRVLSDVEQLVVKHEERVGSDDAMQHTVANILASSLKEAEVRDHKELADAISPVVVRGIKREIKNSRDEMVDAFYPILGRLVSAYVANAFREFAEETNRRLEGSLTVRFLRLRLKSLLTGTPYQHLVLREARSLRVEELFLIRKGSGLLIDHWEANPSQAADGQDEHLVSGMLTAVNEFASEAFSGGHEELRSMDMGASRIFIRASSSCLLAVKTTGYSHRKIERMLDSEMIAVLEVYADALDKSDDFETNRSLKAILPDLAERINTQLAQHKRPPVLAYTFMSFLVAAGAGLYGWHYWDGVQTERLQSRVSSIIGKHRDLSGFPVNIKIAPDRSRVFVSGLAPEEKISEEVTKALENGIAPIPVEARFAFVSRRRDVNADIREIKTVLAGIEKDLRTTATSAALKVAARRLDALSLQLAALEKSAAASTELQKVSEQLQVLVARLEHPRRKVQDWVRSHAIFFGDEDTLRDPKLVAKLLKELSVILNASNAKLRVIGYTDPTGTPKGNVALAVKRARKIAMELKSYGVSEKRLKILGRPNGLLLSYDKGPNSSNRRVEFELIYEEETVEAQGEPLEISPISSEE